MKTRKVLLLASLVSVLFGFNLRAADPAPKKLLLVTVTTGFRHSSIPTAEKVLSQLAEQSHAFTLDFLRQPPNKPTGPKPPAPLKPGATAGEQAAFDAAKEKFKTDFAAFQIANTAWQAALKEEFKQMAPEALKAYDGVIFASTTGELPIPDREGFLAWIKAGHAFIGIHAATDTFHKWPEYLEMIGGEFRTHGAQLSVQCLNQDPKHPANAGLGATWTIGQEEIYNFNNYDPKNVHELLVLDKSPLNGEPGRFPVSWCRDYGQGKVFYTSLGHREDLWDADPALKDRKNSVEISKAYQAHLLGGIKWALGLEPGDATPQAK